MPTDARLLGARPQPAARAEPATPITLGILLTGETGPELIDTYGPYAPMFERLFADRCARLDFKPVPVLDGALPERVDACDAWLVTGSKHGVYDDLDWIPRLRGFLTAAVGEGVPVVGICFGHQILAEAMGGRVEKSTRGWGLGVHRSERVPSGAWARFPDLAAGGPTPPDALDLHVMHQDQVVAPPPGAHLLARSEFCPWGAFAYGPEEAPTALSLQMHPEFEAPFAQAMVRLRRGARIPEATADAALATFGRPVQNAPVSDWIAAFLRDATARRAAGGGARRD